MTIFGRKITDDDMMNIAGYMDDDIREELHTELAPCTHEEFISAYLEKDPEFIDLLRDEFDFDYESSTASDKDYYYWLDTDYHCGDYSEKKWAMIRGELTEDGEKDRDTEEVVAWGMIPNTDDMDEAWRLTDEAITEKLGFLPDYEVN